MEPVGIQPLWTKQRIFSVLSRRSKLSATAVSADGGGIPFTCNQLRSTVLEIDENETNIQLDIVGDAAGLC